MLLFRQTVEEIVCFFVRLCHDIAFEVLSFGNRRQLTKLERVGRRFHRIAENYFANAPFLLLNLRFSHGFLLSFSYKLLEYTKWIYKSVSTYLLVSYSEVSKNEASFPLANRLTLLIEAYRGAALNFSFDFANIYKEIFHIKKYRKY